MANNNTVSSYTQQPVTDYKEDSAPNLNSDKYILDVQANKIEENPYTGNTKEIYEDAKSNNENINSDISSINET
ncbi:MAG: hypothetical protein IJH34_01660 [Romboutsia sp.]|nr:hypothetical protein [Romboutsia sp.]